MIASLNGILTSKSLESVMIEVSGVGYQVFIPLTTYYKLPKLKELVYLYTYTHVREDTLQLYGFSSPSEKQIFMLLIGVSGVGPKLACNILSGMEVPRLVNALRKGSLEQLRSIPGIGTKMAGRLALELKEKVSSLSISEVKDPITEQQDTVYDDALSALIHLGYPERDVRQTLDRINKEILPSFSVEALIKQALRILSKLS